MRGESLATRWPPARPVVPSSPAPVSTLVRRGMGNPSLKEVYGIGAGGRIRRSSASDFQYNAGIPMTSFRGSYLTRLSLPLSSVWLMTDIAEAKGQQGLYTRQAPQLLQVLRETAL